MIGAGVVGIILVIVSSSMRKRNGSDLEQTVNRVFSDALLQAQEHLVTTTKERLEGERERNAGVLEHKKEMIGALIEEMRRDLHQKSREQKESEESRIATFSALSRELELQRTVIHELRTSTEELKRVLSNNQMRGAFGEQVAENLLKMAGFVIGQDYVYNKEQESTDTRPDFTIFLPDKTKINIDVKFPYAALIKMFGTENKEERDVHHHQFETDVKQKIKQVSTRDYINPEEKTVDFVILFIPNEMIFSYIYEQLGDVWEDAMRKKVIFAGPFSFTAILRMIKQAYANFRYQENLHHVIGLIGKFELEYEKYREAVDTLGSRIDSAQKQFQTVSSTRDRALGRIVDQIKTQTIDTPDQKLLEK
ncbi:DNA recombination protein RmuC [Candidatus Uhrbacteria bacterium]|nr:DNA recombination protein RmuC [Candidatus Uhrbacteria bacterium]